MTAKRPFSASLSLLREAGLRPTHQRLALARLLFESDQPRHVTAEELHEEAVGSGVRVSLATIYNALRRFTAVGLLREINVEPGRSYYDTNMRDHHHFYYQADGRLEDFDAAGMTIDGLPDCPKGAKIDRVDIVVRLSEK